jgi:hypothetical protein
MTSCIMSQVVIALHFLYVSCRSRRGRGWAYASLRFELDECGKLSMQSLAPLTSARNESGPAASMTTPMMRETASSQPVYAGARRSVFARLRQLWLQFQQRRMLRCRVFVIPCAAVQRENQFALAQPVFRLPCLRPLQWLADTYPKPYVLFALAFIATKTFFTSVFFTFFAGTAFGAAFLVVSLLMVVHMLGFLSSRRWGLDRAAARHVAKSFRFIIVAVLLSMDVALAARDAYSARYSNPILPFDTAAASLFWCLCLLLDCSPHVPSDVQLFISVHACDVAVLHLHFPQHPAGRCLFVLWAYGYV